MSDDSPWMNPYANPVWGTGTTSLYGDHWIMPRFIAIVNTAHPNVRRQLDQGFDQLQALVGRGENVTIEVYIIQGVQGPHLVFLRVC